MMTNVQRLLESLGMNVKISSSQLQVNCPNCDDTKKHLYIAPANGLGYCHKCSYSPNPYMLIEKVTQKMPAEIMQLLEEYGLADGRRQMTDGRNQGTSVKERKIILSRDEIRSLTEQEIESFCQIKSIDVEAFVKFRPFAHAKEPWVLLPVALRYVPGAFPFHRSVLWLRS